MDVMDEQNAKPPAVAVGGEDAPVKQIDPEALQKLGQELDKLFAQYASDRRLTETKWLRNLRQYLGIYDPEILDKLPPNGSRAYPRVTRAKCISMLSRLMNLMFQGNERNWQVKASPSADMDPEDVAQAVQDLVADREAEGLEVVPTDEFVESAVQMLADKRAKQLSRLIDDQMQELGGDQTDDYVALNRRVIYSGILYGMGVLRGPFVREVKKTQWMSTEDGSFKPVEKVIYKPQYEFHPVWDCFPDMSAKKLPGDGYFLRLVMGRSDLRKLAKRPDFMADQIKKYIKGNSEGNFKAREFETELRTMGTKANVSDDGKRDPQGKYEVLIWNGPVSARKLKEVGVDVPDKNCADDIEAEIWLVDGHVIKADLNPWRKMGIEGMRTIHFFQFDEDDTSPVGNGLPYVIRDSQMSICAATRMVLDNASVTCGPNLEINLGLMRADQDLASIEPYKIWYRDDDDPATANAPAVRKIDIDGHIEELMRLVAMFRESADMESFVSPQNGGDLAQGASEPMRTAAGQSMMRGDAALPFKDIVRNFDSFTQSMVLSLVQFNRKFNPALAPEGDYNVIARGASSLVAKEVRAMQTDALVQTLRPEDYDHLDERRFIEARFATRDLDDMLVAPEVAKRRQDSRSQAAQAAAEEQQRQIAAEIRKTLAEAFKDITQGQKNSAAADATTANTALDIMERGTDAGNQEIQEDSSGD